MPDLAQFDVGGVEECEDDAIGSIHAKAPDLVVLGMELFRKLRGVKGILPKEIPLDRGFALNWSRELGKEFIERGVGRECNPDRLGDQLPERLSLGDPSCAVVFSEASRAARNSWRYKPIEPQNDSKSSFEILN